MPETAVRDKSYDLLNVVHSSLHNVWMLEGYIADAENDGDSELATWFRKVQENNQKAGEQGKQMLLDRLG
jgi:hypothetical protein